MVSESRPSPITAEGIEAKAAMFKSGIPFSFAKVTLPTLAVLNNDSPGKVEDLAS